MGNFTFEEMNLMCIYNTGSRTGLIDSLREMRGELSPEETELRELTDSALAKLCAMTDEDVYKRQEPVHPFIANVTQFIGMPYLIDSKAISVQGEKCLFSFLLVFLTLHDLFVELRAFLPFLMVHTLARIHI